MNDNREKAQHAAKRPLGDIVYSILTRGAAGAVILIAIGIVISLAGSSWPAIQKFGIHFLADTRHAVGSISSLPALWEMVTARS